MMGRRPHSIIERATKDFSRRYRDSPGAATLARLAASASAVSDDALAELRDHMERLGAVLAGTIIMIRMFDIVAGFATYQDSSAFTISLIRELSRCPDSAEGLAMAGREIARRRSK